VHLRPHLLLENKPDLGLAFLHGLHFRVHALKQPCPAGHSLDLQATFREILSCQSSQGMSSGLAGSAISRLLCARHCCHCGVTDVHNLQALSALLQSSAVGTGVISDATDSSCMLIFLTVNASVHTKHHADVKRSQCYISNPALNAKRTLTVTSGPRIALAWYRGS